MGARSAVRWRRSLVKVRVLLLLLRLLRLLLLRRLLVGRFFMVVVGRFVA